MKASLASRLRELRGVQSQTEFSAKIGVKQTSYSSWERGVKDPAAQTLAKIASTFGVSADWLLGLSDERGQAQSTVRAAKPSFPLKNLGRVQSSSDAALLSEIRALKARVKALEDSSDHRSFACG